MKLEEGLLEKKGQELKVALNRERAGIEEIQQDCGKLPGECRVEEERITGGV